MNKDIQDIKLLHLVSGTTIISKSNAFSLKAYKLCTTNTYIVEDFEIKDRFFKHVDKNWRRISIDKEHVMFAVFGPDIDATLLEKYEEVLKKAG